MNKENEYVLLGPEVVEEMLEALNTIAIFDASHPMDADWPHAEWDIVGKIAAAMTNDKYSMPQVTHLSDYQGKHYFESGRVTDRHPVLDDSAEVVTTIYPWGHAVEAGHPLNDKSWDNIISLIHANLNVGVKVTLDFIPPSE